MKSDHFVRVRGLAVCNVMAAAAAQAQDVSFEEARNFEAGNGIYFVAVSIGFLPEPPPHAH